MTTRLYFDPTTGNALWTFNGLDEFAPAGSYIELPDDAFETLIGVMVINGVPSYADLSGVRRQAIARVNTQAGEVRSTFITNLPGQEMLYLAKESEARAWLADPSPVAANYPLMWAEIGLTAADGYQLAQLWLNLGKQWRDAAGQIETARLGAVYAIETATSAPAITAIEIAYKEAMP